jgi:glycosyltransferase involved in cell wall biosynthesis
MNQGKQAILASIICPVRDMGGKLHFVRNWVEKISPNPQIEIILVHDIADTLTGEELIEISNTYRNIRIIEGYYGNPGFARNAGLEICSGKLVVFWDSDDEPNVENFLLSLEVMHQFQSDLGVATYAVCNEITLLSRESNPWSNELAKDFQSIALNPGIWRVIFSRELLNGIRFNPLRMAEDQIFLCEALIKARNVRFIDSLNYTYFTGSSQHLTRDSRALQDLLPAFKQTKELLKTNDRKDLSTFLNTVAARQLISGLRYGNQRTRIRLLISLLDARLFQHDFLIGIKTVFKNSLKGPANA